MMKKVEDFEKRAQEIREERAERFERERAIERQNKEVRELIAYFQAQFGNEPKEVQAKIFEAIKTGDADAYHSIADPIIRKNAIRDYNKK